MMVVVVDVELDRGGSRRFINGFVRGSVQEEEYRCPYSIGRNRGPVFLAGSSTDSSFYSGIFGSNVNFFCVGFGHSLWQYRGHSCVFLIS